MPKMGYHWSPCNRSSGGGLLIAILIIGAIIIGNGKKLSNAANAAANSLISFLEFAAILFGSILVGTTLLIIAIKYGINRTRRNRCMRNASVVNLTGKQPIKLLNVENLSTGEIAPIRYLKAEEVVEQEVENRTEN